MAEGDAPAAAAKDALGFLTKKVGPLPVGVWLLMAAAVLLYLERKKAAASSASATTAANQQTDPAGNVGSIDPATGYVYGTPEDLAALAANNAGSSSSTTGSASGSTGGAQTYADNNAWGIAAINFLVADGIDATTANQAVEQYLASQPLTTAQQADINLVLASPIGPPPSLPGPVATNPGSVTTPPGVAPPTTTPPAKTTTPPPAKTPAKAPTTSRGVTAAVPTGLVVNSKSTTSLQVKWNKSANATGYHILCTDMATKKVTNQFDVSSGQLYANCGGLTAGHSYVIDVWAAPPTTYTGAHAEVSTTLPKTA
jgi:hypothetical protein